MVTFMATEQDTDVERQYLTKVNFETPWVPGSRVTKLQNLLQSIALGPDGRRRAVAVLTKNSNKYGVSGVLRQLEDAGLARCFDAIWILPARCGQPGGAYQEDGEWKFFDPPLDQVPAFKADVLQHVAAHPESWFPQLQAVGRSPSADTLRLRPILEDVKPMGVILVDDQRANFQSASGAQVLRYCKVPRYDARYHDLGLLKDMGGIGAHSDADYETLRRFVEDPWMCKENLQVRCSARPFEGEEKHNPVRLIVFDFDETLTLASFVPSDPGCAERLDWSPTSAQAQEWTEADLVQYNFESPWVKGSRVEKLRQLFMDLRKVGNGQARTLAVLTRNESGVIAVLNLLRIARLDTHFSAIWNMPPREGVRAGAYQVDGKWTCFDPPVGRVHDHKADVLNDVVAHPVDWFPQLADSQASSPLHFDLESLVLVDDERHNFRSDAPGQAKVLRYCKVARYDEIYRDCGPLNQMGGIGAHSDADYETLKTFVERPWEFPYEPSPGLPTGNTPQGPLKRQRSDGRSEEDSKAPRARLSGLVAAAA